MKRIPEMEGRWILISQEKVCVTHAYAIPAAGVLIRCTVVPSGNAYPTLGAVTATFVPDTFVEISKNNPHEIEYKIKATIPGGSMRGNVYADYEIDLEGELISIPAQPGEEDLIDI